MVHCWHCEDEWYVEPSKVNRIKVCPFCSKAVKHKINVEPIETPKVNAEKESKKQYVESHMPELKVGSTYATWSSCTLRAWLNDEFLRSNFRRNGG